MRPLLYLVSLILVLPGVALASAFVFLGQAMATHSLLGFLGQLLDLFLWLIPWGAVALLAGLMALVLGGFSARFRWLAALCVLLLAVSSSAVTLVLTAHAGFSADQLWFFVPAAIAATVTTWLAILEFPRVRRTPSPIANTIE